MGTRGYGGHEMSEVDASVLLEGMASQQSAAPDAAALRALGTGAQRSMSGSATRTRSAAWRSELKAKQVRWREGQGYAVGLHKGQPLGSRLAMPDAEEKLWNFLTPSIGQLVRREYEANAGRARGHRKMYKHPRLFDNLLSSQPMVFNLFGELALHLEQATLAGRRLWPGRVDTITRIEFEWSPGRQNLRYLNNGSAADVALFHTTPEGGTGVICIETKYYEDLNGKDYAIKPRYAEVAKASGAFVSEMLPMLQHGKLQQLWFDHLLLLATREEDGHENALFVVAYPEINGACVEAVAAYRTALDATAPVTFEARTLEDIVTVLDEIIDAEWVGAFRQRYLG
jgi:hypothetical protein